MVSCQAISLKNKEVNYVKNNQTLRAYAKQKGVCLWEVAESLSISEATIIRKLRSELSEKDRIKMMDHIDKIAQNAKMPSRSRTP